VKFLTRCAWLRPILVCISLMSAAVQAADTPQHAILSSDSAIDAGRAENLLLADTVYPLSASFSYIKDQDHALSYGEISATPQDHWTIVNQGQGSFGFTDARYWLRTSVTNSTSISRNLLLEIDYVMLDDVLFKAQKADGTELELHTGDTHPFSSKHIDDPSILFRFSLDANETLVVYSRVKTEGSLLVPLLIWEEKHFFENAAVEQKVHFFYYGVLSMIFIMNLAVFATLRERLYLYYAIAIFGYLMFFATGRGYTAQLFLGDMPDLNSRLFLISMPLLSLFSLLFARLFLRIQRDSVILDYAMRAMIAFEMVNLIIASFADYNFAVRVSAIGAVLLFVLLLIAGPFSWYRRRRAGIYFTLAWTPLAIGLGATSGRSSGLISNSFWSEYAMQIGSGLEALILTLALADRLYREREKKILAQEDHLKVEKQRNATQSLLAQTMSRDRVSKLLNRNRFEWFLKENIELTPNKRFLVSAVHFTRIDEITRTLGLASSERVLSQVAASFNQRVLGTDGVMSITHDNGTKDAAFQVAAETLGVLIDLDVFIKNRAAYDQILIDLALPIQFDGLSLELAPIFGSALYPSHGKDSGQLIRNALIAMDQSDHGNMGLYNKSLDIYSEDRLTLMTDLRGAINSDGLNLVYQPKFAIDSKEVVGLEVLVRWQHPTRGFVPPDQFIPLAEDTGLIHDLTLWVFTHATKRLAEFRQLGYSGGVSINISARDLQIKGFGEQLLTRLEGSQITPQMVYLEVTETAAMHDPEHSIATLNTLSGMGFKISIDDFGAGYSSLSYLKRLPATELKLDRSLIVDVTNDESTVVIVRTTIAMAQGLGYELVAEGVEDQETLDVLASLSCNRYQGYFGCRPLSGDQFLEWFKERPVVVQ